MASRILHPSRHSKSNSQKQSEKPSKLSKRVSLSAANSTSSKIPLQSSSASRSSNIGTRNSQKNDLARPENKIAQERGNFPSRKYDSRLDSGPTRSSIPVMGNHPVVSAPQSRLRRKPTSQEQRTKHVNVEPPYLSEQSVLSPHAASITGTDVNEDPSSNSMFRVGLSDVPSHSTTMTPPTQGPPQFAHLRLQTGSNKPPLPSQAISTPELKPPTPNFARSNSASTRCSESPSPWSISSTPTSVSSCSPAISHIPKFVTIAQQGSPTESRPPATRRKLAGLRNQKIDTPDDRLSMVRESLHSSSSSSTMKAPDLFSDASTAVKKQNTRVPVSPLRVSSKQVKATLSHPISAHMKSSTPLSNPLPQNSNSQSTSAPKTPSTTRPRIPPPRPSREGTPTLEKFKSPIVQSNLTHLETTGHTRRESVEKVMLNSPRGSNGKGSQISLIPSSVSVSDGINTKLQKLTATERANVSSPHLFSREFSSSRETGNVRPGLEKQSSRDPSPMFSSSGKTSSRFGFFSRKAKSPSTSSTNLSTEKPARKGPAAGTGHEGYGRYARRGRSGSASTAASRGRSTSTDRSSFSAAGPASSRKSSFTSADGKAELDEFLKDRLEPVFIGGGGKIRDGRNNGLGLYQDQSGQSSNTSVDSIPAPVRVLPSHAPFPASNESFVREIGLGFQQESDPTRPSLAHRRSLHRMQLFGEAPPVRIPSPINTRALADSPALDTYDSTLSSLPQTDTSLPLTDDLSESHEGHWLNARKKPSGKGKLRKWNIFHRSQHSNEKAPDGTLDSSDSWANLPVGVSAFGDSRPIAHYAIVDGFESEGPENLEDALRQIEENLDLSAEPEDFAMPRILTQERQPSILLPSPPKFPTQFESLPRSQSPTKARSEFINELGASLKPTQFDIPPRLQQVGRIPRVTSKRDRSFRPSPQSFSRPFLQRNFSEQPTSTSTAAPASKTSRPSLGLQTDPTLSSDQFMSQSPQALSPPPANGLLYNFDNEQEFLRFSRRQGSDTSGSSNSGIVNLAPITALLPQPDTALSDDEVWGEFDDLLDHVASPSSESPTTPAYPHPPNHFSNASDISFPMPPIGEPFFNTSTNPDVPKPLNIITKPPKPVLPPRPSFLNSLAEPDHLASPISLSELYAGYGNRSSATRSTIRQSNASTFSGSRYSSQTIISESASPSCEDGADAHGRRVTQVMAEKTYNASSDSLRFSSLMTSRWLSFDRVLFSPVQAELRNSRQDRILVVDGLENDDWSTYCALTYPDVNVYSLCSLSTSWYRKASEVSNADKWMPPTNHRRISYTNISAPFPFPKGFFTAVVFRFPTANTDYAYRNAISECKRVLRPGGYLELSILDIDMVNMGNNVSRAIRNLKVRMQAALPEVSLSPTSDDILKLLGRKGFESISRCVVGIPVTGAVSDSRTNSIDGQHPSMSPDFEADMGAQLSLGALLTGQAQGADLHYPVTKMVARVARWWWSKCYETSILGEPKESMWSNKQLLRECQERETGLRLVICYAQKPISARRRTVSV